jgi:hypothetical protein
MLIESFSERLFLITSKLFEALGRAERTDFSAVTSERRHLVKGGGKKDPRGFEAYSFELCQTRVTTAVEYLDYVCAMPIPCQEIPRLLFK